MGKTERLFADLKFAPESIRFPLLGAGLPRTSTNNLQIKYFFLLL
jgi:hypothetical protein